MKAELTAVYVKQDDWIVATVAEIPGVNTQGRTIEEARENLHEALELVLQANREQTHEFFGGQEIITEPIGVELHDCSAGNCFDTLRVTAASSCVKAEDTHCI